MYDALERQVPDHLPLEVERHHVGVLVLQVRRDVQRPGLVDRAGLGAERRHPVDPPGRRPGLGRVDHSIPVGVDRVPRPHLVHLILARQQRDVGAEPPEVLEADGHVVPAPRRPGHGLAVLRQLVARADAGRPRLEVVDVARAGTIPQHGRRPVDLFGRGDEVVHLAGVVLAGHHVEPQAQGDRQAAGRRPSVVEEHAGRVGRADRQERVDRVPVVVEEEPGVAVPALHLADALRPPVRVQEVHVVLEVALLPVAAALRVLHADLHVVLPEEVLRVVRDVRLDRLPRRLLVVHVGERAVDPVVGPLPPVDVPGMVGVIGGQVGLVVLPESQELGARRRPAGRRPLPLPGRGVVLRLGAVAHRRVPRRLRAPAAPVAVVVLVVVGAPEQVVHDGSERHLRVGVAAPRLLLERPPRRQRGAAQVVVRAEEPDPVLADRAADRAAALPVLLGVARQLLPLADVQEGLTEVRAGGGLVVGGAADERVEGAAAVELVAARLGHHVHGRAREAAVLGLRAEADHSHLLDRVVVDVHQRAERSRLRVGRIHAVDEEHVLVGRAAVRRRARQRVRARRVEHARHRQREIVERVAARGDAREHLLVDSRVHRGRLVVHERTLGRHGDRLAVGTDRQDEVEGDRRVGGDVDVLPQDGLEAGERGGHGVPPYGQVEEDVGAGRRADGGSRPHHRGPDDLHGRARYDGLVFPGHRAGHLPLVDGLRRRRRRRRTHQKEGDTGGRDELLP